MYRKLFISISFSFMALSAFSQAHPNIEKAFGDAHRKENEGKADAFLNNKKIITDSVQAIAAKNDKASLKKRNACKRKS